MNSPEINPIMLVLWLASLVHVGIQSVKYKRVGRPFWQIVLVGFVMWPIGYLLWVFYWPGMLGKSKAHLDSEKWVENLYRRKKGCDLLK
jgi:hypothetical protein